jgi:hypothetical protein
VYEPTLIPSVHYAGLLFPDITCPFGDTISKLVKKVRTRGISIDRKPLKRKRVLTEENLDDIGHRLENPPRKSLRRLAQQSWFSVESAWTATKMLHIRQYKITVAPEIKPVDYEKLVRFLNWIIRHMHDVLTDPKLIYFTDEAILISRNMLTYKTTVIGIVKILMP